MKKKYGFPALLISGLIGVVICALAFFAVFEIKLGGDTQKLGCLEKFSEVYDIINKKYVGDADMASVCDGAFSGMVESLGDRWSYYLTADENEEYQQYQSNSYTGIGISIVADDTTGLLKVSGVAEDGPASVAGVQIGDSLAAIDGEALDGKTASDVKQIISGKNGAQFELTLRASDGTERTVTLSTATVVSKPVKYEMLDGNIGYIKIKNFEDGSGDGIVNAVDDLVNQGAKSFVFDVRNNPGGKLSELLTALDHLLPAGVDFISVDESGKQTVRYSDAEYVNLPSVVLVNSDTYSAAEFFAEALSEYKIAEIIGSQTTGKSRSQVNISLSDGSAVHISTNGYLTPMGKDLAAQGGITPDVVIDLGDDDLAYLKAGQLSHADDEQLQAAIYVLS